VKSDEQLIEEIRHGSRTAFETLFARYREPVWRFFRRRTRRADLAEELAQDTFVAVLEGAGRYAQRGSFSSPGTSTPFGPPSRASSRPPEDSWTG